MMKLSEWITRIGLILMVILSKIGIANVWLHDYNNIEDDRNQWTIYL